MTIEETMPPEEEEVEAEAVEEETPLATVPGTTTKERRRLWLTTCTVWDQLSKPVTVSPARIVLSITSEEPLNKEKTLQWLWRIHKNSILLH